VLTDILLPEMTGLELMERATELKLVNHFIVISSYSNFRYAQQSVRLGALDYILKPFEPSDLLDRVRTVTQSIEKERQLQRRQHDLASAGSEALKRKFVLGLCLQNTALQEHVMHNLRFWQLEWLAEGPIRIASMALKQSGDKTVPLRERELQSFVLGNIAREVIQSGEPFVLVQGSQHEWVLLAGDDWSFRYWIGQVQEAIRRYQRMELCAGISAASHSFEQLPSAFEQSKKTLILCQLESESPIIDYTELPAGSEESLLTSEEVMLRISEGQAEDVVDQFLETKNGPAQCSIAVICPTVALNGLSACSTKYLRWSPLS
ncbi:MAG: signal transduction response regulator, partial [Paenibacillus sp.]|nr:signal transduction response regulator [Paenibacillus sp.]